MQGILIVDKPTDWTSFDVIAKLRGILGTRKLGHSGTLDPMATGVLPVFCGGASKAVDLQLDHTKAYRATLKLGARTDTGDVTGTVLETAPVTAGEKELLEVLPRFVGPRMQTPPMYSAVKINGQPLYKLARQGMEVERKARPIEILSIQYEGSPAENEYTLTVKCSKGTYIRVLLEEIAEAMGQKGTMSALRRVAAGVYTEADAHSLEEIQAAKNAGSEALQALMLPVESVFTSLPLLVADERVEQHLYNGCPTSRYAATGCGTRRASSSALPTSPGACSGWKSSLWSETEGKGMMPMQIYSQLVPLALGNANGSAVAMGFFDGIHIGHRAVIEGAVQWARAHGASPAVFTFKLPTENKMKGKRLLSTEDKHALIERLGVEHYLCPDFEEIKAMTPEQFVLGIVRDCNAKALFCGENFTFGAKAAGNPELLRKLCAPLGVEVVVLPMARFEEKPVSSTRIRTALEGGDIPAANAMLGMPYAIRFAVHHGAGLGRTLGVPTINQLYPQGFQLPRFGIYITRTKIRDTWYPSATGLGTRPTVNDDLSKVTCETFIPGFSGDLYGTDPVVEFYAYLSPSKKFDTLDELRDCINHAARRAQEYFQ